MKTADLIPFILLELNEQDKYGFELTKNIETKSNSKIVIKQPTLYTLLKKLEKSKFISSYWLDSEIGGKRHYYKLTENGRLQVATLPSYEILMKNALEEDDEGHEINENLNKNQFENDKKISIMDELLNSQPTPVENILPTEDVFADNNIDNATEIDINILNSQILKNENTSNEEKFANNENVVKFAEKIVTKPIEKDISNHVDNKTILDVDFSIPKNDIQIEHVDYYDIKNNDNYKKSKNITKKLILQSLSTSASLMLIIIVCSIVTSFTGRTGLYYMFLIGSILTALFYPILIAVNADKIRLKYQNKEYAPKTKLKLYICLSSILAILLICIIVNVSIKNNTFVLLFRIKNFANLYAPVLISSTCLLDVLYNHTFFKNLK